MNAPVQIRAARPEEYAACRMLLPPGPEMGLGAEYLVAIQEERPFIAGAAFYISESQATHNVRLRVIRTRRGNGIGRALLSEIVRISKERGSRLLQCAPDAMQEPEAASFLVHCGFTFAGRMTTVNANAKTLCSLIFPVADRLTKRSPERYRIVALKDSPTSAVTALYRTELARSPRTTSWALLGAISLPRFDKSRVLLAREKVAGFLLYYLRGDCAVVPARVVAPEFQHGIANVLLMASALHAGLEDGIQSVEFDVPDHQADTVKLARRVGAVALRSKDQYFRSLNPE